MAIDSLGERGARTGVQVWGICLHRVLARGTAPALAVELPDPIRCLIARDAPGCPARVVLTIRIALPRPAFCASPRHRCLDPAD